MTNKTLYQTLVDEGHQVFDHETDLYFYVTSETTKILEKFPLQKSIAQTFKSNIDDKLMYDVPFAFDPAWKR